MYFFSNFDKKINKIGAGFECSMHGNRDFLKSSFHTKLYKKDYANLSSMGINVVRTGLRTSAVSYGSGRYDFSDCIKQALEAKKHGIYLIWDLLHYDYPRYIKNPFSTEFTMEIVDIALAFCKELNANGIHNFAFIPINEMVFYALCVDDNKGFMLPKRKTHNKGTWLKICIKTTIEVAKVLREYNVPVIAAEPGNHEYYADFVNKLYAEDTSVAKDIILGVNCYPNSYVPLSHNPEYFINLIRQIRNICKNKIFISETGFVGDGRVVWLKEMVNILTKTNVPFIVWYPIINNNAWDDPLKIVPHGCFEMDTKRTVYKPLFDLIKAINQPK